MEFTINYGIYTWHKPYYECPAENWEEDLGEAWAAPNLYTIYKYNRTHTGSGHNVSQDTKGS